MSNCCVNRVTVRSMVKSWVRLTVRVVGSIMAGGILCRGLTRMLRVFGFGFDLYILS